MALKAKKRQGKSPFRVFMPKSLSLVIFLSVAMGVVVTEAVLLIPFAMVWKTENIETYAARARAAFMHATDPATFPTVDDGLRTIDRFMREGLIQGGAVLDASGDQLGVVGERPFMSLEMVRRGNIDLWASSGGDAFDVYIDPSTTGMANSIIVRMPMAPVVLETNERVKNTGLAILGIVLGSSLVSALMLHFTVVRPIRVLRQSIMQAVDNPDVADEFKTGFHRQDELGSISRSLDLLFTAVSILHQEELATLHKQNELSLVGVLQFSGEGRLISANPAALFMLGYDSEGALRRADSHMVLVKTPDGKQQRKTFMEIEPDDQSLVAVELMGTSRQIAAHVQSIPVRRRDGTVARHFITIIELERMSRELNALQDRLKKSETKLSKVSMREQETKRLLESCLCLMDTGLDKPKIEPSVMPDRIVNDWYREAADAGLVAGKLEHNVLPQLEGDPGRIRDAFRQALLFIYARTTIERPTMSMEADMPDENTARFIIRDISKDRIGGGRQVEKTVDWRLPFAALQASLAKTGGKLIDMAPEGAPPRIVITLKASRVQPFDLDEDDFDVAV